MSERTWYCSACGSGQVVPIRKMATLTWNGQFYCADCCRVESWVNGKPIMEFPSPGKLIPNTLVSDQSEIDAPGNQSPHDALEIMAEQLRVAKVKFEEYVRDTSEQEDAIRELCRPHLPPLDVDGDSDFVPTVADVVESLVEKIEEYEFDISDLKSWIADRIGKTSSAKSFRAGLLAVQHHMDSLETMKGQT